MPYTCQPQPGNLKQKYRKMNRLITEYGVKEKYAIGDITRYKVLGTLWRHKRKHIKQVAEICAALVCRRKQLI